DLFREGRVHGFRLVGGLKQAFNVGVGDILMLHSSTPAIDCWALVGPRLDGGDHTSSASRLRDRARKVSRNALRARVSCDSMAFSVTFEALAMSRTLLPSTYFASRASR